MLNKIIPFLYLVFIFDSVFAQERPSDAFMDRIKNEKFDLAYQLFSSEVKTIMSEDSFIEAYKAIETSMGALIDYEFLCAKKKDSNNNLFYTSQFTNGSVVFKFVIDKNNFIQSFTIPNNSDCGSVYSPPSYEVEDNYIEKQIDIGIDDYNIPSSLTMPLNQFHTIAILISGSGSHGKDVNVGKYKIFRDLSIGLSNFGIASFKYDKPIPETKNQYLKYTIESEYIDPVSKAIELLKDKYPDKKIILIGHSLGGMIAPHIAMKNKVSGVVLMAPNYRPLEDLYLEQLKSVYEIDTSNVIVKEEYDKALTEVRYLKDSLYSKNVNRNRLPLYKSEYYWKSLSPYNNKNISYDIPTLLLYGDKDKQVPIKDFNMWRDFLEGQDNYNKFLKYSHLDHLFVDGDNVSYQVIKDISNWVDSNSVQK